MQIKAQKPRQHSLLVHLNIYSYIESYHFKKRGLTALFFSPTALLTATIWKEDIFRLKIFHIKSPERERTENKTQILTEDGQ